MANIHELVGSKVQLYQRNNSPFWWCAATIGTKRHRISTKKLDLREATTFAEDWVLNLRGVERWGGGSKSARWWFPRSTPAPFKLFAFICIRSAPCRVGVRFNARTA